MSLPLRNWKQTKQQVNRFRKNTAESVSNLKAINKKAVKTFKKARYEYGKTKEAASTQLQNVQRYGVSRTVLGQKSIYAPRPSTVVVKKASELKRKFFGGSIYD